MGHRVSDEIDISRLSTIAIRIPDPARAVSRIGGSESFCPSQLFIATFTFSISRYISSLRSIKPSFGSYGPCQTPGPSQPARCPTKNKSRLPVWLRAGSAQPIHPQRRVARLRRYQYQNRVLAVTWHRKHHQWPVDRSTWAKNFGLPAW